MIIESKNDNGKYLVDQEWAGPCALQKSVEQQKIFDFFDLERVR